MEKLKIAFQEYLSEYFDKTITVLNIREIPGGFLSKAYVLSCLDSMQSFELFSRTISSNRGGYAYPIDRFRAFNISDQMYKNANGDIMSHGIMTYKDGKYTSQLDFSNNTQFFHIQDYKVGSSYQSEYFSLVNQDTLTEENKEILRKIASKIAILHTKEVPEQSDDIYAKELYIRGYRELLINPELTLDVFSQFDPSHSFFGQVPHKHNYLEKMHQEYDRMILSTRERKLSFLHGDFWSSNILIDTENNPFFIDYSRIPYGDAGIDIGWFVGNFVLEYIKTKNRIYLDAAKVFMDEYIKETGDKDILQYLVLPLFWLGIINIFPPVFGDHHPEIAKEILRYIEKCFKEGELLIEELHF
ncbi:MAG: phosphotransferase [Candidatus Gracilibacteria bacterium]|nr:phosphotransferase [Candidatus Gracilibacteria bacterium]